MSQENFAAEVEMHRSYYGKVERGESNASTFNLIKIADALRVNVGDLFPSINNLKRKKPRPTK